MQVRIKYKKELEKVIMESYLDKMCDLKAPYCMDAPDSCPDKCPYCSNPPEFNLIRMQKEVSYGYDNMRYYFKLFINACRRKQCFPSKNLGLLF